MSGETAPVTFFVAAHAENVSEYNPRKPQAKFMTLVFPQRPPDPLIASLGAMLQLKADARQRKDQRIVLTPESMEKIGLQSRDSRVEDVQGRPDLISLSIRYTSEPPIAYAQKLSGYFGDGGA